MRSLPLAALAAVALTLASRAGAAFADEPVLPSTKIVVLDPKQSAAWGGPAIAKGLRKKLDVATGGTIPVGAYNKALKLLKLKGAAATDPANVARAGKQVGADYVLVLNITKKGWLFTANAVLINTANGEQQMDFKSGYYKPKVEAADRAERIARVTVEKLLLLQSGGPVAVAPPPPAGGGSDRLDEPPANDRGADRVDEPPTKPDRVDERPATDDRVDEPTGRGAGAGDDGMASGAGAGGAGARDDGMAGGAGAGGSGAGGSGAGSSGSSGSGGRYSDPSAGSGGFSGGSSSGASSGGASGNPPNRITEPRDTGRDTTDLVRATVQGGAGVLHTFDLDSSDGRRSRLSYQLDPLSLITGEVEVLIPVVNTGVFARAAFSPVRFEVTVGTSSEQPGGSLLDLAFGLKVHLALSGEGRETVRLSPLAGLKVGILGVSDHPSDLILGSTSVAPFLGAELSLPITAEFEALVASDVGFVVGYSESPVQAKNGEFGSGILFGAGVGLRYWLSDAIGVAFDGRFDLRSLSLTGPSQRQVPSGENITDATIGNRDLRFSIGVALRL